MAMVLEEFPANVCQAREQMKVVISSDATDPNTVIRARVLVEDTPLSDEYSIRTEVESPLVDGLATFYLEQLFKDELLRLTPMSDGGAIGDDVNVCKRWKLQYYEWNPANWTLVAEAYHDGAGYADVPITPLDTGALLGFYVVLETNDPADVADVTFKLGMTEDAPGIVDVYPDEIRMFEAVADEAYDTISIPGHVKVSVYEVVTNWTAETSAVRFALLGGGLDYLSV